MPAPLLGSVKLSFVVVVVGHRQQKALCFLPAVAVEDHKSCSPVVIQWDEIVLLDQHSASHLTEQSFDHFVE